MRVCFAATARVWLARTENTHTDIWTHTHTHTHKVVEGECCGLYRSNILSYVGWASRISDLLSTIGPISFAIVIFHFLGLITSPNPFGYQKLSDM